MSIRWTKGKTRQEESREKEGMKAADEGTEEGKRKMRRIRERKGCIRSGKGRGGQQQMRTDPNPYKPTTGWRHMTGPHREHRYVLLHWCLVPWVLTHTGLWFWTQFLQAQSYFRGLAFLRISPAKTLINWFWNQNVRALQESGQRSASMRGASKTKPQTIAVKVARVILRN